MKRVAIFGTGKFFRRREERLNSFAEKIEVVTYLDNNPSLWGNTMGDVPIISPNDILDVSFDAVVLMSVSGGEMASQLLALGVPRNKIWSWEKLRAYAMHGTIELYDKKTSRKVYKKRILIISTVLSYNGGSLAAVYAAMALENKGYDVILAVPHGNEALIAEVTEGGVAVAVCPAFPYMYEEEKRWIRQFDAVIVNVFQMIAVAGEVSRIKPTMWWIHEPSDLYEAAISEFGEYACMEAIKAIKIYAVSSIPKKNFNSYFPERINGVLGYGIPDEQLSKANSKSINDKLIIALIGAVIPRKAQDVFIRAVNMLKNEVCSKAEFWVIGFCGSDDYGNKVRELAASSPLVKIRGEMTRSEITRAYASIDVVVCPSLEDPLPIVMTEGMMHGKVCIASDASGTADYIRAGENGMICRAGDVVDLSAKMEWIIEHRQAVDLLGKNARSTYEKFFTLEKFAERLENVIENIL